MAADAANNVQNSATVTCVRILTQFIDRTCVGVGKEQLEVLKASMMEACVTYPDNPHVMNKLTFLFSQLPPEQLLCLQSYSVQMLKILQDVLHGKQADEEFDQLMKSISLK